MSRAGIGITDAGWAELIYRIIRLTLIDYITAYKKKNVCMVKTLEKYIRGDEFAMFLIALDMDTRFAEAFLEKVKIGEIKSIGDLGSGKL